MSFGSILKELRKANHITQGELADFLKVSRPTIAGYETKDKQPDFDKLIKLSQFFNVSIDYLITGDSFGKSNPNLVDENQKVYSAYELEHSLMRQFVKLSYESRVDLVELSRVLQLRDQLHEPQNHL